MSSIIWADILREDLNTVNREEVSNLDDLNNTNEEERLDDEIAEELKELEE